MSWVSFLGLKELILNPIINFFVKVFCWVWFLLVQAIAWLLDMLTELFFIFAGMTPVGGDISTNSDGVDEGIDIVNFFLTQDTFQRAYLWLCGIALALIVVFTIGKIIKQDYFDRSGPRSKAPIFRNVALSFIAFICIIPIFYFLVQAAGALALLVMRAMGYEGGGVGTILFNISWSDNGKSFEQVGVALGGAPDAKNFGWYPSGWGDDNTFYRYFWNSDEAEGIPVGNSISIGTFGTTRHEFYWYIFLFAGLILIVNLGKMMIAMVTRMYNLIALFIVAPSPISQIVLDDGAKFSKWKDKVIQEALKVVGCVMSFMLFIMIAGAVNNIDLMKFAYSADSASAVSLIESNGLTAELSNIDFLYYGGADIAGPFDKAINALGRAMIMIAGVGAIQDIDQTITPFISGGSTSADLGNAGKAIVSAGGAAAKGALALGRKGVGLAVGGVEAIVNGGVYGARSIGGSVKNAWNRNKDSGGEDTPPLGTPSLGSSVGNNPVTNESSGGNGANNEAATDAIENTTASAATAGVNADGSGAGDENNEAVSNATENTTAGAEGVNTDGSGAGEENNEAATDVTAGAEGVNTGGSGAGEENDDAAADATAGAEGVNTTDGSGSGEENNEAATDATAGGGTGEGADAATDNNDSGIGTVDRLPTMGTEIPAKHSSKAGSLIRKGIGTTLGTVSGLAVGLNKMNVGIAKTAAKSGLGVAGILAKTVMQMTGMGAAVKGVEDFASDSKKRFGAWKDKHLYTKDKNGNKIYRSAFGKAVDKTVGGLAAADKFIEDGKPIQGLVYATARGLEAGVGLADKGVLAGAAAIRNKNQNKEKFSESVNNIQTNAATINNGGSSDVDVQNAANNISQNADNLSNNVDEINNYSQSILGNRDVQLDVSTGSAAVARENQKQAIQNAETKFANATVNEQKAVEREQTVANVRGSTNQAVESVREVAAKSNDKAVAKMHSERDSLKEKNAIIKCAENLNVNDANYNDKIAKYDSAYLYASGADRSDEAKAAYEEIKNTGEYKDVYKSYNKQEVWKSIDKSRKKHSDKTVNIAMEEIYGKQQNYEAGIAERAKTAHKNATNACDEAQDELNDAYTKLRDMSTLRDDFEDAKTEYNVAKQEYDDVVANRPNDSRAVQMARENLAAKANALQGASDALGQRAIDKHVDVKEQSDKNRKINKTYDAYNENVIEANLNIGRMKANVGKGKGKVSQKAINNAETELGKATTAGQAARQSGRKIKVKVSGKVANTTMKKVNSVNYYNSKQEAKNKQNNGDNANAQNTANNKPEVEVTTQITPENIANMYTDGIINKELSNAVINGLSIDLDKASSVTRFNDSINALGMDSKFKLSNEELNKAIQGINPQNAVEAMDKRGITSFDGYKSELRSRYENANTQYTQAVQNAKNLMNEFNSSGGTDTVKLEAVRKAITDAVSYSKDLQDVRVEIEKGSNK